MIMTTFFSITANRVIRIKDLPIEKNYLPLKTKTKNNLTNKNANVTKMPKKAPPPKGGLKLYWGESPRLWWEYAEDYFDSHGIKSESIKYQHLVRSLQGPFRDKYGEVYETWFGSVCHSGVRSGGRAPENDYKTTKTYLRGVRSEDIVPNTDLLMVIDPSELTEGAVKSLLTGEWNQEPFRVQIIDMQPCREPVAKNEYMFVEITDGRDRGVVRISPKMTPKLINRLGNTLTFPVIYVTNCECDFVSNTYLYKKIPGKIAYIQQN